jgi:ubiquinone/menaquinone biosynthesis C-methylase UbiE
MDAADLPYRDEFDAAVIGIALHEMPPQVREKVWESMRRTVHPAGRLVALDFAVPQQNNLFARIAGGLIERDERSFLNIFPEHYANFQEFMRSGGLLAWVKEQGLPVEAEYRFWGGTIAVVILDNQRIAL